jgi:hypothetical protein
MVEHPAKYPRSYYRANALGESSKLLTPHALVSSGRNEAIRQASHRDFFKHQFDPNEIDKIRTATNANYALEITQLQKHVSAIIMRRLMLGRSDRPRTGEEVYSRELLTNEYGRTVVSPLFSQLALTLDSQTNCKRQRTRPYHQCCVQTRK